MQIQLLTSVPTATVREMARAAAERDECLDLCNVFLVGTDRHTIFAREYLIRMGELKGFDATGGAEFTDLDIVVLLDEEVA